MQPATVYDKKGGEGNKVNDNKNYKGYWQCESKGLSSEKK